MTKTQLKINELEKRIENIEGQYNHIIEITDDKKFQDLKTQYSKYRELKEDLDNNKQRFFCSSKHFESDEKGEFVRVEVKGTFYISIDSSTLKANIPKDFQSLLNLDLLRNEGLTQLSQLLADIKKQGENNGL